MESFSPGKGIASTGIRDSDQVRFERYHPTHPRVFELFKAEAARARRRGCPRLSANMLLERVRWIVFVTERNFKFTCDNHFSSRYARLLIAADPTFEPLFRQVYIEECDDAE